MTIPTPPGVEGIKTPKMPMWLKIFIPCLMVGTISSPLFFQHHSEDYAEDAMRREAAAQAQENARPADRSCIRWLKDDIEEKNPEKKAMIAGILADQKFTTGECRDMMNLDVALRERDENIERTKKLKELQDEFNANH